MMSGDRDARLAIGDVRDSIAEYHRDHDPDRKPQDRASDSIAKLVEADRSDLLSELLVGSVQEVDVAVLRDVQKAINDRLGTKHRTPLVGYRLSECFPVWLKRKLAENRSDKHINEYKAVCNAFVESCDDCDLSKLTKPHFVEWQNRVDETKGDRGEQWRRQQLIPIGAVLRQARKLTDWTFPTELDHWLEVFEYKKPKPHKKHKTALSVEHFHMLPRSLSESYRLTRMI